MREDKSEVDALKGLQGISVLYGRSVLEPRPLFRRGRGADEKELAPGGSAQPGA